MTFVPGNKAVISAVIVCCISVAMLFEALIFERKSRLRMYEKAYSVAIEKLEENNRNQK